MSSPEQSLRRATTMLTRRCNWAIGACVDELSYLLIRHDEFSLICWLYGDDKKDELRGERGDSVYASF
jgi:hypothetical protein